MSFLFYLLLTLFLIVAFLLSFVVLIQESKSMGLGSAFGSDNGSSVFGTATADVLKSFTGWMAVVFASLCIILSIWSAAGTQNYMPVPTVIEQASGE
ncbi:MAG: preprotein translocase subunit SecG [Simkaniaceae bacterium]|nr:preprotein translocase subunit SecG [Simkaniaceae bacterium]MCF7851771.1 preprotein translocase subunit SecG [Simkaniaceae bacterium]